MATYTTPHRGVHVHVPRWGWGLALALMVLAVFGVVWAQNRPVVVAEVDPAQLAATARYDGLARYYGELEVARIRAAQAAKWEGLAEYYRRQRVLETETARLAALNREASHLDDLQAVIEQENQIRRQNVTGIAELDFRFQGSQLFDSRSACIFCRWAASQSARVGWESSPSAWRFCISASRNSRKLS